MIAVCCYIAVSMLSFTREPEDVIVWAGASVLLPCYVDELNISSVTFVWYRNGENKIPSSFSEDTNGSLTITIPQSAAIYEDYDGLYHCLVSNQHTTLRSRDASLRGKNIHNTLFSINTMIVVCSESTYNNW